MFFSFLSGIFIFINMAPGRKFILGTIICLLFCFITIKPIKLKDEEEIILSTTDYIINNKLLEGDKMVLTNNIFFKYFYNKRTSEIYRHITNLDTLSIDTVPKGSLLIWDTHYGYKPKWWYKTQHINWYIQKRNCRVIKKYPVQDQSNFQAFILEKD